MSTPGVVDGHTRTSPYDYTPSAAANIAFLATFSYFPLLPEFNSQGSLVDSSWIGVEIPLMVLQYGNCLGWHWYFRNISIIIDMVGEIIGYVGRVGSAFDVTK